MCVNGALNTGSIYLISGNNLGVIRESSKTQITEIFQWIEKLKIFTNNHTEIKSIK
jgi:hypothetical protein